ncbi:S8 family serine peptidase [Shewanella sp. AS1]|uniref:S8 family serine peptidase n=1 Tax=Shewanella sp. AS1 TaxID=2907626 RepID=UPI001F490260|nr:S8 family serine peptidase [Shewanella sp. AS1]MCE9679352.1 S8 family serine peptidase [Shewanella sp. AS1]
MKKQTTLLAAAISAVLCMPALAADPLHMVVEYKPGKGNALKTQLADKGIGIRRDLASMDSLSLTLSKEQYLELVEMDGIAGISVDAPRKLMSLENSEASPYGIAMVQADQIQNMGGKKVCIIDSGYDLGHPDLPAATVTGADDGGSGPWYEDGVGHGTHVAGTVAALGNGAGVIGVNPDGLDLHIVRVFNGEGSFAYASDLAGAVNDCIDAGSSVISMSLGGWLDSNIERRAMDKAAKEGILMIAAAGNDANAAHSYPASYDSVMSVAAIDFVEKHASFSQRTSQVEISGPGVQTLSTVPRGTGANGVAAVSQNGQAMDALAMVGSSTGSATSMLASCGLGTEPCDDAAGKICLIERGEVSFGIKVANCEAGGGVAAIVYNNQPGGVAGDLGGTSPLVAVGISQEDGMTLLNNLDVETTVSLEGEVDYDYKSGTSMATPHVSGVASLVWSHFPDCSANAIRHALTASAMDLDEPGYDYKTGWGLVQAKAAFDYLTENGCNAPSGKVRGGDGSAR